MKLTQQEIREIVQFVKEEPRTVSEISKLISKSWVTTEKYLKEIELETNLLKMKVFRKGSHGALKVVHYVNKDSFALDEVKESLLQKIKAGQKKSDFNFLDLYAHISSSSKRSFVNKYASYTDLCESVTDSLMIFSGNLSFLNRVESGNKVVKILEDLLKRKVFIKILCRVNLGSLKNIDLISPLVLKYPGFLEIKHCYQPLRGLIIDDTFARFSDDENLSDYKQGEIEKDLKVFYEITDKLWVTWLKQVFWSSFRTSVNYDLLHEEIKQISK